MKFIVYQVQNCFAVYTTGEESAQVFFAYFEKYHWWYHGKSKENWKRFRYFNAEFLLEALIEEQLEVMDVAAFCKLYNMMSDCCVRNFEDVFA